MKQMYPFLFRSGFFALLFATSLTTYAHEHETENKIKALQQVAQAISGFEENKGQLSDADNHPVPFVFFKASALGVDLYLTDYGMTYVILNKAHLIENNKHIPSPIHYARIDMELKGATIRRDNIVVEQPLAEVSNYYYSHCPKGITNVHKYGKITVRNIYPGIDWVWYTQANGHGMKYDFVVHPGADVSQLQMVYRWADLETDANKQHLYLKTPEGELIEGALRTFSGSSEVASSYVLNDKTVSFKIGAYDKKNDLIIDPPLANLWGTYFGGGTWEKNTDIKHDIDAQGNVFVTCNTISTSFPTINPGGGAYFVGTYAGGQAFIQGKGGDATVMKFSNTGVLLWSTFVGGSSDDNGVAIACDANNEVWVTGCSMSTDFPTVAWGTAYYQSTFGGGATTTNEGGDAIMMKFDNSGVMQWSTYMGGIGSDMAFSMDNDPSGNIWITGRTASNNLPLVNAGGTAYYQATLGGMDDIFITKFSSTGAMVHSTYYGGTDFDHGEFLMCDASGDVYVTGATASTNFPLLNMGSGAYYQSTHGGTGSSTWGFYYRGDYGDAYVLRFANNGQQKWGTFLGGNDNDAGRGLTISNSGSLYVIGDTKSPNFPLLQGSGFYQSSINGNNSNSSEDVFIAIFSPTGAQQHTTFFGGSTLDCAGAILADACGHVYATGHTTSTNLPTVNPGNGAYFVNTLVASDDVWFLELNSSNNMTWMTYNGSSGFDEKGTSLRLDPSGNLFATGYWCFYSTSNGCYDPGGGAYYKTNVDADDFFIMKFQAQTGGVLTSSLTSINATCNNACDGSLTASGSGSCFFPYTYLWSTGDTTATISGLCAGNYAVIITDANGDTVMANVTITQPPAVNAAVSGTLNIIEGDSTTLTASGGVTYLWSDSSTTSSILVNPTTTTTYSVIVFDVNGCPDTISVTVTVEPDNPIYIWVPNVFTPNGDNNNDAFFITSTGFTELHLWVYNRWGQLVHVSNTMPLQWNGINLQNNHSPDGTYYWIIKGIQIDGKDYENKGFLTLIDGNH
jgi:gliding motility-associated-like protein